MGEWYLNIVPAGGRQAGFVNSTVGLILVHRSRVFSARERVLSSCTSLARIRDNLQELGTKTANFVLILFLF